VTTELVIPLLKVNNDYEYVRKKGKGTVEGLGWLISLRI
jgi:hypothetical protein